MKIKIDYTFTEEEVELIRKYGCGGVDCNDPIYCEICPFSNMTKDEKYKYALEHIEKESEE